MKITMDTAMSWMAALFGPRGPSKSVIEEMESTISSLKQKVEEFERRDALRADLIALSERVAHLQNVDLPKLRTDILELRGTKEDDDDPSEWSWRYLEKVMTPKVASWSFGTFSALLVFVGFLFFKVAHNRHDAVEYISYAFPIAAAILAGLTVYAGAWAGRFFIITMILLFLGLDAFIAAHPGSQGFVLVLNVVAAGILTACLVCAGVTSVKRTCKGNAGRGWKRLGLTLAAVLRAAVPIAFGMIATDYGVAFFVNHKPCFEEGQSELTTCEIRWVPSWRQLVFPWPDLFSTPRGN